MESGSPDKACSARNIANCADRQSVDHEPCQFQPIVEAITSAVFIFQADKLCYVNPAAQSMTGYSEDELLSMPFWAIIHEDFQDVVKQRGRLRQGDGDVPPSYEVKIVRKNGETCWVKFQTSMIEMDGKPAVLGMAEDITERKQAEQEHTNHLHFLENMEQIDRVIRRATDVKQMMSDILQNTLDIFETDRAWLLYPCDPDAESWYVPMERTRPEYPGAFALGEDIPMLPEVAEIFRGALDKDGVVTVDSRDSVAPKETDERFSILSQMHMAVYPQSGKPWLFGMHQCSHHRDWTDEEKNLFCEIGNRLGNALNSLLLQHELQVSEMNFRNLVEADCFALVVHSDFHLLYANSEALKMFKVQGQGSTVGKSIFDYIHPRYRIFAKLSIQRVIRRNESISPIQIKGVTTGGQEIDIDLRSIPTRFDGSPAVMTIIYDITERKQAEEALRDNRVKLAEAQRIGHMGNWEFDVIRGIGWFSDETYRIFGVENNYEGSFKSFFRLVHPEDRWLVKQASRKAVDTGSFSNIQYRIVRPDGSVCFAQANGECQSDESGRPCRIFGTIQDITDRKLAGELAHKLSQAVDQAGGSIMITNKEGSIEYVNPAFTKITGYSSEEAIGQSPRLLKSGEQDGAFYEHMWKTITSGGVWHGKVIDKRKDGSFFPAMLTIAPIVNNQGVISHFVGSHADISELENMEKRFYQAQKMEAVGTLVGGIAHDFKQFGYISASYCR